MQAMNLAYRLHLVILEELDAIMLEKQYCIDDVGQLGYYIAWVSAERPGGASRRWHPRI
jgi:hypothetical protein